MTNEERIVEYIISNKRKGTVELEPICKRLNINSGSEELIVKLLLDKGIIAKAQYNPLGIVVKESAEALYTVLETEPPVPAGSLKELLKASPLSNAELAKRIGVSVSTVYRASKKPEKYLDVVTKIYAELGVAPISEAVKESVEHDDEPEIQALIKKEKVREAIMIKVIKKMSELKSVLEELI